MKRFLIMLAALAACLMIPGSAFAGVEYTGDDCEYATANADSDDVVQPVGPVGPVDPVVVYVHTNDDDSGMSGSSDVAAGACADQNPRLPDTGPLQFAGGAAEVGSGDGDGGTGAYAVVDGDDENRDPANQGDGYAGLSTYEDGDTGDCTGGGTGSNSGGSTCVDVLPGQSLDTPLVCGNTSGNDWAATERDGCSIP